MSPERREYRYRHASDDEKERLLAARRQREMPLHAPPHYPDGKKTYLISAACFEHRPFIHPESRRDQVKTQLIDDLRKEQWADLRAWVVLPNHYHLLGSIQLAPFREWVRLRHSQVAREWNREEGTKGRQVWYRFQDRAIRNEGHYLASLNYIHANPQKHGYTNDATTWRWSSLTDYLAVHGRERMALLWREYPLKNYGKGWDW